jgi:hypothetical protein
LLDIGAEWVIGTPEREIIGSHLLFDAGRVPIAAVRR